jgi:hypothetical protein
LKNNQNNVTGSKSNERVFVLDIALLVYIFSFILFYPVGILGYICGLGMLGILMMLAMYGFPPCSLVVLACVATLLYRAFFRWKKLVNNSQHLMIMRFLVLCFAMVALLSPIMYVQGDRFGRPFIHGFHRRMIIKTDVPSIREWLLTVEIDEDNLSREIHREDLPKCLLKLQPPFCIVKLVEANERIVNLIWGTGFGHWGLVIGSPKSSTHESNESDYILPLEPGVYVWLEIQ